MSAFMPAKWNVQALVAWLEQEAQQVDYRYLEEKLELKYGQIDWWRTGFVSRLSDKNIQAIARYRRWRPEKVRQWLGLTSLEGA